jgi:hypothetical protein
MMTLIAVLAAIELLCALAAFVFERGDDPRFAEDREGYRS